MSDHRLTRSIGRLRKALEKELDELDRLIDNHMRGSAVWVETEKLLVSVPGVGKTIARTLIADLPELGSLDRRQIAALVGLAPWTRQSGQWRGKSFIGGGRKSVRSSLFVGAMVAARYNPQLKRFRDRLVAAGKPKLLALVAVARKLITSLTLFCEIDDHGSHSPLDGKDSRSLLQLSQSVSQALMPDSQRIESQFFGGLNAYAARPGV